MKQAWFVPTSGRISSTPIVWQNSVIFSDWTGELWRVDAGTGKVLWQRHLETPQKTWQWHGLAGSGVMAGSTLVEASVEGDAWGLNAASGRVLWHVRLTADPYAGNLSDLLYDGTRVYVGMSSVDEPLAGKIPGFVPASRGSVIALDPATGAFVWQTYFTQPPSTGAAVWSSFSVDPALGLVYCDTGNNYTGPPTDETDALLALDAASGGVVWKQQVTANDVWVPPMAFGPDDDFGAGPQLFTAASGGTTLNLVGAMQKQGVYWVFDRATGAPVWHTQVGKSSDGEASIGGGRVFLWANARRATGQPLQATVMALDPATGQQLWARPFAQAAMTAAAGYLANDVYFAGDNTGVIRAYRASDGKTLWTGLTGSGRGVVSSLWAQGRSLYAGVGFTSHSGLRAFRVP